MLEKQKWPRPAKGNFRAMTVSLRPLSWYPWASCIKLALNFHSCYFCLQWNACKGEGEGPKKNPERRKRDMSPLRKVQRFKERKSNLHPSTLLQLEESKLLEQCYNPWHIVQYIENFFFFCLNTKVLGIWCKVLKDRGKCIINTAVQSLLAQIWKNYCYHLLHPIQLTDF